MNFYKVQVDVTYDTERGPKKRKENYVVSAVSVTDAEVRITKRFDGYPEDWECISVKQENIVDVVLD